MSPVVFLIKLTTTFCDKQETTRSLIFRISSPEFSLPSSAATLSDAILLMNTGALPRVELAPPTMLKPRLSLPLLWSLTVYSTVLWTREGGREGGRDSVIRYVQTRQTSLCTLACKLHPYTYTTHRYCWEKVFIHTNMVCLAKAVGTTDVFNMFS